MINEKEKLQLKLEIYNDILNCFPCSTLCVTGTEVNSEIDMSLFEENLEDEIKKIKIQLNTYKKIEGEMKYNKKYNKKGRKNNGKIF